jgi:glycosyltransferase involved in cell wall biosynthesis
MPLISIIIPAFNATKTIQETVESVLEQTFSDFELIVINSGTNSKRPQVQAILQQFNDSRIKIFDCDEANASVNRNRGIVHATAPLIAFLDADDLWTPTKLEAQYQALQNHPTAAVAYSATECIDEASHFLRRGPAALWAGDVYGQLLIYNFIISGSNVLVRADAIAAVGPFDETLPNAQDYELWLRLAEQYDFVPVNEVQVRYRVSTQSLSFNIPRTEQLMQRILAQAFACPKAQNLQHLKPQCFGNLYKYLTSKSLETAPQNQKPFQTLRLLTQALRWDPSLLSKPIMVKIILKVLAMLLVPRPWMPALLQKFSRKFDTTTLLGYLTQPAS